MLLNMDGFDDNITPLFYANPGGNTPGAFPAFSAGDSVAVSPRSNLHTTAASYHGRSTQFCGNTRPWSEANMYPYGAFQRYPSHYSTTDTLHDPGLGHSDQTPSSINPEDRSSMTTGSVLARSREDAPWQMYLSASLSDSLHSLDLNIPEPGSLDLAYPQPELPAHEHFSELERLESPSSTYQSNNTTQAANDVQRIFCTAPLVSPQPRNIRPALLSMMSTQDTDNSLLLAQGDNSTKADIPSPPLLYPSPSRGRSPTITRLVNHSSVTRPGRGLTGWGSTNYHEPPVVPSSTGLHRKKLPPSSVSQSKLPNSGSAVPNSLSPPPLSSGTTGSSRNSERLLKRSRNSDESPPNSKRASKARRLMVADIDTEDDDIDKGGDDADSDDYTPSRSPSLNPSRSISPLPSSHSVIVQHDTSVTSVKKKTKKKGKGKAKGSAALALAVVSQMTRDPSAGRGRDTDLSTLQTTRYGVRRRKNHPIPLPIPVPNLNKKSRGRKVPHVVNDTVKVEEQDAEEDDEKKDDDDEKDDDDASGQDQSRSSTRSRRRKPPTVAMMAMSKTPSGENRTFICVVSGCGKCFVRSEHLKRHVRSIHTHDKRE